MTAGSVARAGLFLGLAAAVVVPESLAEEAIQDNSFLIEEAYNQGRGVVQHIGTYVRLDHAGSWASSFTQEWPVPDVRHQLSYTLTALRVQDEAGDEQGIGDLAINYRYQVVGDGGEKIAMSPRASLLLPAGDDSKRLGSGAFGMQVNLPTSVVLHPKVVTHFNVGATWLQGAKNNAGDRTDLMAYSVGQSVVGLLTPRLNVLVELVFNSGQVVSEDGTRDRVDALLLNPGIRWSHSLSNGLQIVPGISVPIGLGPTSGSHAVFLYLSFEHAF